MPDVPTGGTILDCTVLCSTFPSPVLREIARDAVLNLLDDFFASGIQLLSLEGKPEIGKTRILSQFARRHPSETISIFVKPNSWFIRDLSLLFADIAMQMQWALTKSELADPHSADEAQIRRLSFDLHRAAKRPGKMYYFVIDGVEDITEGAGQFANALLAILPLEYSSFRFLFSGEPKWMPGMLLSRMVRKSYPLSGLSLEETIAYFNGCNIQRAEAEELYRSCSRGTPGYLASARRLLEGGMLLPS